MKKQYIENEKWSVQGLNVIDENECTVAECGDTEDAQFISEAPAVLRQLKTAVAYFEANGGDAAYTFLKAMKETIAKVSKGKENAD